MSRRTLKQKVRYATRSMYPNRMTARVMSGGRHQTIGAWLRSYVTQPGPRTYKMADEQNLTAKQRAVAPTVRGRSGAKKAAAKKPDVYAAAKQIPARNRATAAKAAKKTAAGGKKQQYVQGAGGLMQGSVVLPGADLSHYRRAVNYGAVIQPGEPNRRRL